LLTDISTGELTYSIAGMLLYCVEFVLCCINILNSACDSVRGMGNVRVPKTVNGTESLKVVTVKLLCYGYACQLGCLCSADGLRSPQRKPDFCNGTEGKVFALL